MYWIQFQLCLSCKLIAPSVKSSQHYSLSQWKLRWTCVFFSIDIHFIPVLSSSGCQLSAQVRRPAECRSNQLARWPDEKPPGSMVAVSPCQRWAEANEDAPASHKYTICINIWRVMWAVRKTFCHITNHLEACPWAGPSGRLCTCVCQQKFRWRGIVGSCPSVKI